MKSWLVAACVLSLCAVRVAAAAPACALTEQQFSEEVDRLTNWPGIRAYQQAFFPPCPDEGAYAQAHSELVVRTLAERWGETGVLAAELKASPAFRQFFFKHLNAQGGKGPLQEILNNATIRCPRQQSALCAEIRMSAGKALEALQ